MAYTSVDNSELYFQTKLYTGNGGTQSITLDGSEDMQPDWVWIKNRSGTDVHALYDSVRGVNKNLRSDATSAEGSQSTGLTSFDSDGFGVGDTGSVNTNSNNFVSWNWKAGTSFSNDASATSIGTIDSAGSISTASGFSIITWTGNATSSQSVAHGLGAVPKAIFTKNTNNASQPWKCYFSAVGNAKYLQLNTSDEPATSGVWSSTTPTSSIISISNDTGINGSGNTILAYCFTDIKGYLKIGSYTGNGNTDGTFVYTGFKPAFVMIKRSSSTGNWYIADNKRDTFNVVSKALFPNANSAEGDLASNTPLDFTSNGFKLRNSNLTGDTNINISGSTYVYMTFAESPFVNSNGVPNNAR